jgi:hypothetical protein
MQSVTPDIQKLADRVEKLEVANRRWKFASSLLLLSGVSLFLLGAKAADRVDPDVVRARTVEAQDFVLKDENGHVYAMLTTKPSARPMQLDGHTYFVPGQPADDSAALRFYDEKGRVIWTAPPGATMIPVR